MLVLLLALMDADAGPLRKVTREPAVLVLAAAADARVGDLRVVDGKGVVVVVEPDGDLLRFEGVDRWEHRGEVRVGAVDEVAIDGAGDVWVLAGGAVRRWTPDGLQDVALPLDGEPIGLRHADHARIGADAPAALPLGVGLVVDLARAVGEAMPTERLVVSDAGWRLEGDDRAPLGPSTSPEQVDAIRTQAGWVTLVGPTLRLADGGPAAVGRLPELSPSSGNQGAVLRTDATGAVIAIAWDPGTLRASTLRPEVFTPIRFDRHWVPAGGPVVWPRAVSPDDALPVASRLDVPLPSDFRPTDVAVLPKHVVIAGGAPTRSGRTPALLVVERIPGG